jgi:hypothetical protein
MTQHAQADNARLSAAGLLVLHGYAEREYAYGPIGGMPAPMLGAFTQDLHDLATRSGWAVASMKRDWRRVFPFEQRRRWRRPLNTARRRVGTSARRRR